MTQQPSPRNNNNITSTTSTQRSTTTGRSSTTSTTSTQQPSTTTPLSSHGETDDEETQQAQLSPDETWAAWAEKALHLQLTDLWHIAFFLAANLIGAGLLALFQRCCGCCCRCGSSRRLRDEEESLPRQVGELLAELGRQRGNMAMMQSVSQTLASQAVEQQRVADTYIDRFATELREMRLARFGKEA